MTDVRSIDRYIDSQIDVCDKVLIVMTTHRSGVAAVHLEDHKVYSKKHGKEVKRIFM